MGWLIGIGLLINYFINGQSECLIAASIFAIAGSINEFGARITNL